MNLLIYLEVRFQYMVEQFGMMQELILIIQKG